VFQKREKPAVMTVIRFDVLNVTFASVVTRFDIHSVTGVSAVIRFHIFSRNDRPFID
jgi:hypothetical protein